MTKRSITKRIYYVSNAFEESVKNQRGITTDSPAANRKVITLCKAVKQAGGDVEIISLGRGRVKGTWKSYSLISTQADIVPITYLPYLDASLITHLVTMVSLFSFVIGRTDKDSTFIFYNYYPHYLLALLFCKLTSRKCILDIEDGVRADEFLLRKLLNLWLLKIHNWCCRTGVMLAATALEGQASGQSSYICYGVSEATKTFRDWQKVPLQVHFGGSLLEETGAILFLDTLDFLMRSNPEIFEKLRFVVTGFGPYAHLIGAAAKSRMNNFLHFYGNVSSAEYQDIIQHSHIGLCLKLSANSMGATTFPSKVLELASYGLLLVSTKVSDVPLLFDNESAIFLDEETPRVLAKSLVDIAKNPNKARNIAFAGQRRILNTLSEEKIGSELLTFCNVEH